MTEERREKQRQDSEGGGEMRTAEIRESGERREGKEEERPQVPCNVHWLFLLLTDNL